MPTYYNVLILSITKEHSALLKFRANYYDLAMLDYLMPHLNGLELYRRINDIDSTTKCCIITATQEQLADDEHVPQGRKKLRMIRKPIGNEELLTEINSILGQDSIAEYLFQLMFLMGF
jgi:DNA-binding response OmpR family regulator